ncbi:uncharacterized protein At3g60930, chloroplastic-like [Arabidopsis lyrata subsp. lyrata]|uniref:uncharacterized protein At3g60930, chloroplastic-like n=1 Tax=Arabidopsis lyrata subsp. lyrata TaxID=81972 RepID=UPI000A29BD5C|nr:uncharacterized protein At3g60930, chloroplastic-like [Arabidopsis lyrata subsp. lyrata]|eukprot:XP_020866219.1 uncharacterized protein At3g60930, chloroplastic-like [Arabidopsis lyrata subsp. lyrata]
MQGAAQSLRAKKAAERKAAEEKRVCEATFGPSTPPEVNIDPQVADGAKETEEVRVAADLSRPEASGDVRPDVEVPAAAGALAIVALGAEAKAKAKGKRPRGDSSGGRRREKRSRGEVPIYKDKIASANLIASCSGPPLSAPEALLEAFNSMNSMVRAYDSGARKSELAREKGEASAKAEKVERLKASEDSLRTRRKLEVEIARLHRLFTEEKALREKEIIRERRAAKREFAEKVKAIEAKMDQYGKVSTRYMYLVQARANAELIAELEEGKKVEDEKAEVLQWTTEYGDAEDEYVRLGTELREDLKLPPVSPDSVDESFGNRSIEGAAAAIGVADQSGSNRGTEVAQVSPVNQDSI